jgi:Protein of unknown function (DUF2510)
MSPTGIPPGWHPDPGDPTGSLRWWDGEQWTSNVLPATPPSYPGITQSEGAGYGSSSGWGAEGSAPGGWDSGRASGRGWDGSPAGPPPVDWGSAGPGGFGSQSFIRRNQQSLYAIALATLYLVLSLSAHLVLFGIVPIFMSSRAWRHREPLAPVAITASVITLLVAVATLTHH